MPLEWFGSPTGPSVGQLMARKKFARAIEVLREQLRHEASNPRVRMQLADVLVMAGSPQEAAPVTALVGGRLRGAGRRSEGHRRLQEAFRRSSPAATSTESSQR